MGKAKGVNTKVQAGLEKKAENKRKKDAEKSRKIEEEEAKDWLKGSNTRGANRKQAEENKADEAARKRREKEELLAADEASLSKTPKPKASAGANVKKSKNKKKNKDSSLALLEESLIKDADKKLKGEKRALKLKKEKEEREAMERRRKEQDMKNNNNDDNIDPLLKNTYHNVDDNDNFGRKANVSSLDEAGGTGLDSALSSINIQKGNDQHPEKRMKAAYKAYEEKMLPQMKEEYPGLKLSQYKEKIFTSWKKSSENPMNQQL